MDFCCNNGSDPIWVIEDSPVIDSFTVTNCGVQKNISLFLPIELGSFYLQRKDRAVICHWTTLSETNNNYFTIWKSTNGYDFNAIGQVQGTGNSSQELHYEFIDIDPSVGLSYYRLSQTDFDGKSEHFKPKSIDLSESGNTLIYFDNHSASVSVSLEHPSNFVEIDMYDLNGRLLNQYSERNISNSKDHSFDVAPLPKGLYIVRLSTDKENIIKKIWISHTN